MLHKVIVMDESMNDELVSELFDLSLLGYWLTSWNVKQEAWNYSFIDLKFISSNDMTTNIDADTIGMVLNLIG